MPSRGTHPRRAPGHKSSKRTAWDGNSTHPAAHCGIDSRTMVRAAAFGRISEVGLAGYSLFFLPTSTAAIHSDMVSLFFISHRSRTNRIRAPPITTNQQQILAAYEYISCRNKESSRVNRQSPAVSFLAISTRLVSSFSSSNISNISELFRAFQQLSRFDSSYLDPTPQRSARR